MKNLDTAIDISASPAQVWAVLTDFASYPSWNPFVRHVVGELRVGRRLAVEIAPPGGASMSFKPRVLVADPERELRWKGQLLLPGLFDGEHVFRIEPVAQGARLHQSEQFSGVLVPLMPSSVFDRTKAGFNAMNQALKQCAEGRC